MINKILGGYGLENFDTDRDKDRLVTLFDGDSLLFKRILRLVLRQKLGKFFRKQISDSERIENLIPRSSRPILVYRLEKSFEVNFPKMTLSRKKMMLIILIYAVSFACTASVYISIGVFSIFPHFFLFLGLVVTVPSLVLGLISLFFQRFFAPLDWNDISDVDDLLWRLVVDIHRIFSDNDFSRTIVELEDIVHSGEYGYPGTCA